MEVVPKGASYRTYIPYSVSKLVHRLIRLEFPPCATLRILWIMRVTRSSDRGGGGRMVRVSREHGTLFESGSFKGSREKRGG